MQLPIPEVNQVRGVRRYLAEYLIIAETAAIILLCYHIKDLNREIRNDTTKALYENKKTVDEFIQWQRFARPIRDEGLMRDPEPDTGTLRRYYFKY